MPCRRLRTVTATSLPRDLPSLLDHPRYYPPPLLPSSPPPLLPSSPPPLLPSSPPPLLPSSPPPSSFSFINIVRSGHQEGGTSIRSPTRRHVRRAAGQTQAPQLVDYLLPYLSAQHALQKCSLQAEASTLQESERCKFSSEQRLIRH